MTEKRTRILYHDRIPLTEQGSGSQPHEYECGTPISISIRIWHHNDQPGGEGGTLFHHKGRFHQGREALLAPSSTLKSTRAGTRAPNPANKAITTSSMMEIKAQFSGPLQLRHHHEYEFISLSFSSTRICNHNEQHDKRRRHEFPPREQ